MNIDGEPCKHPQFRSCLSQLLNVCLMGGASPKDKEIGTKNCYNIWQAFNPSESIPIVTKGVPSIMQASNTAVVGSKKWLEALPGFNNSAIHDSYNATNYQT